MTSSQTRVYDALARMACPVRAADLIPVIFGDVPSWRRGDCYAIIHNRLRHLAVKGEVIQYRADDGAVYWYVAEGASP